MLALVAVFGVSLVALAQGSINLANELVPHGGLAVDNPGNYYVGTFGMEVWELNSTSIPAGINVSAASGAGVLAFVQPTANESGLPPVLPNLAMTQDLVMTSVPEPGAFPLTGLGASVAFILRRRCALKVRGTQHEE